MEELKEFESDLYWRKKGVFIATILSINIREEIFKGSFNNLCF